ncbi:MAG: PHP domain-containing protein [bacterium]
MIVDLHTHTRCSDGTLTPDELVDAASSASVDLLAITDHDTIAAYDQLQAKPEGLKLIGGVEFSTTWNGRGIHLVGVNLDLNSAALSEGTKAQTDAREARAVQIAERLEKKGIADALQGAKKFAANGYLGRPHFAQYLVACGAVANVNQAFKKYLGAGKAGDIKQVWASLPQVVRWIRESGGTPVLAHPLKYKLTLTKLRELTDDFIAAGGQAMEVISGQQTINDTRTLSQLCRQKNLLASSGSDFHMPGQSWARLGKQPSLPENCAPIWDSW